MGVRFITSAIPAGNPTTSFTVTIPATVLVGDLLLLVTTNRDADVAPTVSDTGGGAYTEKSSVAGCGRLFYKRAVAATAGATLTASGFTGSCAGVLVVLRGAILTGDPFNQYSHEANASGNETHAQITTTVPGCWIGLAVSNDANDNSVTNSACTTPGALTEGNEKLSMGGSDCAASLRGALKLASAGATGAFTWTQADGATVSQAMAIAPEPDVWPPIWELPVRRILRGYTYQLLASPVFVAPPISIDWFSGLSEPVLGKRTPFFQNIFTPTEPPPVTGDGVYWSPILSEPAQDTWRVFEDQSSFVETARADAAVGSFSSLSIPTRREQSPIPPDFFGPNQLPVDIGWFSNLSDPFRRKRAGILQDLIGPLDQVQTSIGISWFTNLSDPVRRKHTAILQDFIAPTDPIQAATGISWFVGLSTPMLRQNRRDYFENFIQVRTDDRVDMGWLSSLYEPLRRSIAQQSQNLFTPSDEAPSPTGDGVSWLSSLSEPAHDTFLYGQSIAAPPLDAIAPVTGDGVSWSPSLSEPAQDTWRIYDNFDGFIRTDEAPEETLNWFVGLDEPDFKDWRVYLSRFEPPSQDLPDQQTGGWFSGLNVPLFEKKWRVYPSHFEPIGDVQDQTGDGISWLASLSEPAFETFLYAQSIAEPPLDAIAEAGVSWFVSLSQAIHGTWRLFPSIAEPPYGVFDAPTPDEWFERFSEPVWAKPHLRKDLQRANIDCIFRVPLTILLTLDATETKDEALILIDVNGEPPPEPAGAASVVIIEIPLYNRLGSTSIIEEEEP